MKFNPITKEIFSNQDEFIKKIDCPFKMSWENLKPTNSSNRKCSICDQVIIDTKQLSDENMIELIKKDDNICFKIDINQNNLTITTNGFSEQK